jgi:hypothetical protein
MTGPSWLLVLCWRRHAVLAGLCAAAGIALVVLTLVPGYRNSARELGLIMALVAVVIGSVLFVLGQALQRMLDTEPEESS